MMGNLSRLVEDAVIFHHGKWPNDNYDSIRFGAESVLIWKCEFNAAADRLRGKPDWSEAPEWACWLAQSNDGKWHWYPHYVDEPVVASGCFLNKARACCAVASEGELIGDWRNTLEKRPEHVGDINEKVDPLNGYKWGVEYPTNGKRPNLDGDVVTTCYCNGEWRESKVWAINWPESSFRIVTKFRITDQRYKPAELAPTKPWFETGELPKAGECCEYKFQNPDVSWQLVQVNYISEKHAILTILDDGNECHADGFKAADFRPVRTDKEKTIDAAIEVMQPNALTGTMAIWFGKLYDAGLLRLPNQK